MFTVAWLGFLEVSVGLIIVNMFCALDFYISYTLCIIRSHIYILQVTAYHFYCN